MRETVYLLLIWLGVASALALVLFGWDKLMAKLHRRRVPEAALLGCALLGGSAGAALGMALFRHKTRKPLFRRFVPLRPRRFAALGRAGRLSAGPACLPCRFPASEAGFCFSRKFCSTSC